MNAARVWIIRVSLSLLIYTCPAIAQKLANGFYEAIRGNNLAALRAQLATHGANFRDDRGSTPLMYAAALGNMEAFRLLLDSGADVNAANAFGATALMWCADQPDMVRRLLAKGADVNAKSKIGRTPLLIASTYSGNTPVVRLLLTKGANVRVRDNFAVTPLLAATAANDLELAKVLLERGADIHGADVHAKDFQPGSPAMDGLTPLMNAAAAGNAEMVRLLVTHGADVNTVTSGKPFQLKNGPLGLTSYTALTLGAAYGGPETVRALTDHGANVHAADGRGLNPLTLALATDRSDPRTVRWLLAKGADPAATNARGESAADWARRFQNPRILEALNLTTNPSEPVVEKAGGKTPDLTQAIAKSISLLQRVNSNFMKTGGCVACHGQNLTAMAVQAARANGFQVDEPLAVDQAKEVRLTWTAFQQPLLQRIDSPGGADDLEYSLFQMGAEQAAADQTIDAMVFNLAGKQHKTGNWHGVPFGNRAPMEDGDFSRTAMAVRCLRIYGPPSRKAEYDLRIQLAAAWLQSAQPVSLEEQNMQLLGLLWAGKQGKDLQKPLTRLIAAQRSDGGWSQTPGLPSDAYATGQVLFTLHELGVPAGSPEYRRGVGYLLRTQLDDGSWHVRSRAVKFQPYFESGFPHGQDQWISSAATAWAAIGLAFSGKAR